MECNAVFSCNALILLRGMLFLKEIEAFVFKYTQRNAFLLEKGKVTQSDTPHQLTVLHSAERDPEMTLTLKTPLQFLFWVRLRPVVDDTKS